jgi:hypothetical protein
VAKQILRTGDEIRVNGQSGEGSNTSKDLPFQVEPMSPVQYDIYKIGGLFQYGKKAAG